jgi:hypothetical protein
MPVDNGTPPLPDGFVLAQNTPPLPDGFVLDTPRQQQSAPVTATGVAKAAGQGIREGVESLAGLPGDIQALSRRYVPSLGNWLYDNTGVSKTLPTSEDVSGWTSKYVSNHEPANKTEERVANIAAFIPYALGGPEDLLANVAKRALLPGVVSQAAGEATQGTALETPARMVGALVAPSGRAAAIRQLDRTLPSAEELIQAGGTGSQAVRDMPAITSAAANQSWIVPTAQDLTNRNLLQRSPQTAELLSDTARGDTTASSLDLLKNTLRDIQSSAVKGAPEHTAATEALRALDEHIASLSPSDMVSGDANSLKRTWADSKADYAAGKRTQAINDVADRAINRAAGQGSGMNVGNNVRQAFAGVLKDTRGYNADEEQALRDALRGTMVQNLLRDVSSRLGGEGGVGGTLVGLGLKGAGGLTGLAAGGLPGGVLGHMFAEALVGHGLQAAYNRSTVSTARDISRQLAMRSPLAQQLMAANGVSGVLPSRSADFIRRTLQAAQAANNTR